MYTVLSSGRFQPFDRTEQAYVTDASSFCGTTEKFCDAKCQSNCGTPTPPAGRDTEGVRRRVIGYYETWSTTRKCHTMAPKGIPVDGLTHVNFAFAYIEPGTYKVTTMDGNTPANLF